MTCSECRDLMLEVARRKAAPFVDRSVLAHTAGCVECWRALERERSLTAALAQVVRDTAGAGASAGVENLLLAAFAAERVQPAVQTSSSSGVSGRWLPAAAAVLLAAGGGLWWMARPGQPAQPASVVASVAPAAVAPKPEAAALPIAPTPQTPIATVAAVHRARPVARPVPTSRPDGPVEAVGFVPIPSAAGLPAFESGEIVRLGIPVTALPNFGVDIPGGGQGSVEADLLIGQDGQARAIRLVTATAESPRPRQ